jgi:hypothetical protein
MPETPLNAAGVRRDRVLLIGVARSGTSWVGRAFGKAPNVRFYYEPDNIDADPTGERPAGGRGFGPYPIIEPLQPETPFGPVWDWVFSGRSPFSRGSRRMKAAGRVALRLPRPVRNSILRGTASMSMRLAETADWKVAKTIYAPFSLEWLARRYQPQVVAVQRHPLNVVSSWRQLRIPLFDLATRPLIHERYITTGIVPPLDPGASELTRITWHVGLLTHVIGEALERHPEWHLFTHEDLCIEPLTSIRRVFDAVDVPWSQEVADFLEATNRPGEGLEPVRVTSEQPDRWRGRLEDAEVDEIDTMLAGFPRRGWLREPVAAGRER